MLNALKRFLPFDLTGINVYGINFPSAHEARWLTEQVEHSPDLGWLEEQAFQLFFTPDDTRLGYERHGMIEDGAPLCGAYTQQTFEYWLQEVNTPHGLERTAVPLRKDGKHVIRHFPPPLKIKGEVHCIRPWQFRGLDNFKRNRKQFRRQRVNVLVPYKVLTDLPLDENGQPQVLPSALAHKNYWFEEPERVHVLRCWMYVGVPEYWNDLLDVGFRGFKSVNRHTSKRPWLQEYYDFPKHPLEE